MLQKKNYEVIVRLSCTKMYETKKNFGIKKFKAKKKLLDILMFNWLVMSNWSGLVAYGHHRLENQVELVVSRFAYQLVILNSFR